MPCTTTTTYGTATSALSDFHVERKGLYVPLVSICLTCFLLPEELLGGPNKTYTQCAGGAFSRPNLVFNTAQPQLHISQNPPAAAMPSTLWPQRFPGSGSPPSNLYMPSIPEPHQAAPMPAQNGEHLSSKLFVLTCMPAGWQLALQL